MDELTDSSTLENDVIRKNKLGVRTIMTGTSALHVNGSLVASSCLMPTQLPCGQRVEC